LVQSLVFNAEIVQLNCNNGNYVEFRVLLNEGKNSDGRFLNGRAYKPKVLNFFGMLAVKEQA